MGNHGSVDASYAANLADGKLDVWISQLCDESLCKLSNAKARASGELAQEAVWVNGVPEILNLVRGMLVSEPEERLTAREIRDAVEEILERGVGIQGLCCRGRLWESGEEEELREKRGKNDGADGVGGRKRGLQANARGGAEDDDASSINSEALGLGVHIRSRRVLDQAIETQRSGGVPVRRRKLLSLPWRRH